MVVDPAPRSSTDGAVESTSSGSESRSASRPSANRIQNSLAGRPDGWPRNQPGSSADRNSMRSAMLARPNEATGTPTHSAGGGSAGGEPSRNTSPSRPAVSPSWAKAAVARTTSWPSWLSADSPNAVVRPLRITAVRTAAGPAVPGRRKKPDTTIGSGNGTSRASARMQVASMYPPLTAPAVPFHRLVSSAVKAPSAPAATTRLSSSNAKSPTSFRHLREGQDLVAVLGDEDRVLELRSALAVLGYRRPAVRP